MLLTILLGLGLAKAQMETLRDGGLVSETVILFVPRQDASVFTVWPT
jgi:hypothetical protein